MLIGCPKEIKPQEFRVGLMPSAVFELTERGHQVVMETNAGTGAGFNDEDYTAAGAEIVATHCLFVLLRRLDFLPALLFPWCFWHRK